MTKRYETIEEIMKANMEFGHGLFANGMTNYSYVVIYPEVFDGRFFITSQKWDKTSAPVIKIREALEDGEITTVFNKMGSPSPVYTKASADRYLDLEMWRKVSVEA